MFQVLEQTFRAKVNFRACWNYSLHAKDETQIEGTMIKSIFPIQQSYFFISNKWFTAATATATAKSISVVSDLDL